MPCPWGQRVYTNMLHDILRWPASARRAAPEVLAGGRRCRARARASRTSHVFDWLEQVHTTLKAPNYAEKTLAAYRWA